MNTYVVTKDADMMAPDWLTSRINYKTVKLIYILRDGAETLKGVRIGNELVGIGDTIAYDGKRLSVTKNMS